MMGPQVGADHRIGAGAPAAGSGPPRPPGWTLRVRSWPAERLLAAALWGAVAIGAALRLAQYLLDRSLWIDEAFISLDIVHRSLAGLMRPLDYFQGAPPAFLAAEWGAVTTLGPGELALRLWPLMAGLGALVLFALLARRVLEPVTAVAATAMFALAGPLVSYSSQVKPYSVDALVATAMLTIGWAVLVRPMRARLAALAAAGVLAPWLSFPALIMFPAMLLALAWPGLRARRPRGLAGLAVAGAAFVASAAALYVVSLRHLRGLPISPTVPEGGYVPHGPLDLRWYGTALIGLFRDTVGVPRPIVGAAILVFLVGAVALWRRRRDALALLLLPIGAALLAAALQLYGFGSRFSVFLVPSLVLVMAVGLREMLPAGGRSGRAAGVIALVLVVGGFAALAATSVGEPSREEIKPVLSYVAGHRRKGDTVFVDYWAQYAFAYYGARYGFPTRPAAAATAASLSQAASGGYPPALRSVPPGLIVGPYQGDFSRGLHGFDQLRHARRLWLIFSHQSVGTHISEEALYRIAMNRIGRMEVHVRSTGASAYLYDLRPARSGLRR